MIYTSIFWIKPYPKSVSFYCANRSTGAGPMKVDPVMNHIQASFPALFTPLTPEAPPLKILVFFHHSVVGDALVAAFTALLPPPPSHPTTHTHPAIVRIDGRASGSAKAAMVAAFQGGDVVRVALCSIEAASSGITMTAAAAVVFAELSWSPQKLKQAEDRCASVFLPSPIHPVMIFQPKHS